MPYTTESGQLTTAALADAANGREVEAPEAQKQYAGPLFPGDFSDEMRTRWESVQAGFVDDPSSAIREADSLVCEVMHLRGYPMADFDHRTEDLSVDHPHVVRNYRAAHEIAVMQTEGRASTEDLRRAMVHYRQLFDELLETQPAGMQERRR